MKARAVPWLVALVALAVYLISLSRHWTGDSIEYALAVEWGDPAYLLDPYHPLLHPLALLFFRLWQWAGWTGRALLPLQVLNAVAGALCAGLVADIARRISGSGPIAAIAGVGFAVSGGPWLLGVEAEFATVPLAFALLVLWLLFADTWPSIDRPAYPLLLGLATVLAILSYASGAFPVPVVLLAILSDGRLAVLILIFNSVFLCYNSCQAGAY